MAEGKPLVLLYATAPERRTSLRALLDGQGYDIVAVASAEDALNAISAQGISAALIEVAAEGVEAIGWLRRLKERQPDVAVVALIDPAAMPLGRAAGQAGAAGVIWTRDALEPEDLEPLRQALAARERAQRRRTLGRAIP
jgi:DNA-binding NarL/FixJ family response regulator